MALVLIELHLPYTGPLHQLIQALLELHLVFLPLNLPSPLGIICKLGHKTSQVLHAPINDVNQEQAGTQY